MGPIHEVNQATRSGNEDITALLELLLLVNQRSTPIHNAGAQHGTVAQTASLIKDLSGKLPGRSNHKHQRFSANSIVSGVPVRPHKRPGSRELLSLSHQLGKNRDQKRSSFSGA